MCTSTMSEISSFFKDPKTHHPPGEQKKWGILHVLRRDIIKCFTESKEFNEPALWPGAMAILAGVDLLGKFWRGDDSTGSGEVGKRFRDFLGEYFDLSQKDAEVIYQLRNSLLHSFGLYSKTKSKNYKFILSQTLGELIEFQGEDTYKVGIHVLREKFENAIAEYHKELISNSTLQDNFNKMVSDYGWVYMG